MRRACARVLIGVPPSYPPPPTSPGGASGASSHRRPPTATRSRRISRRRSKRSSGEGPVHLRHPELPDGRLRRHARPGVQDDRAPVPGGRRLDPEQALGLLHARATSRRTGSITSSGNTSIRPTRSTSPATSTRPSSRTTTGSSTGSSASLVELIPEDAVHDRHVRSRRPSHDGRPVLQRLADPGGIPGAPSSRSPEVPSRSRTYRSIGPGPWRGATAATTDGCS